MQNVYRYVAWFIIAVVAVVLLSVFMKFLLEMALLAALLGIAYYGFTRASSNWRNRHWR